jgi:eukaryotic-like serine/threonine-protein kinase
VQIGRGVPDTRRPRTRQQVLTAAGGDALAEQVLMRLSGMSLAQLSGGAPPLRLLVLDGEKDAPAEHQRVDLVHETLLREVRSVAGWIDAERTMLERLDELEVAARAWEQADSPREGLPTGSLLDHYRGPASDSRGHRLASTPAHRFLRAAQRNALRRKWIRRGVMFGIFAAIVAVGVSASRAWEQQRRAGENLQLFIGATDSVVSDTDWELARYPHVHHLRSKILKRIEASFASLVQREYDTFEVRKALIKTKHRLSDLARENDSLSEADRVLVEALHELRLASARWPGREGLQWLLPLNHSKRGKVALAQGRLQEARAHFLQAISLLEKLVANDDSVSSTRTLAVSYAEQADLELEVGQISSASRLYDLALQRLERNDGRRASPLPGTPRRRDGSGLRPQPPGAGTEPARTRRTPGRGPRRCRTIPRSGVRKSRSSPPTPATPCTDRSWQASTSSSRRFAHSKSSSPPPFRNTARFASREKSCTGPTR